MSQLLRVALAFLRRDLLVVRPWEWVVGWLNSSLLVLFWHFLTRFVKTVPLPGLGSQSDYFTFSLIGLALAQYVWSGFSAFSNRVRVELTSGSLEPLWVSAYPFPLLVSLSGIWTFITATINAGVILAIGTFGFGAHLRWDGVACVIGVGFLTSLAMGAVGLVDASWAIVSSRGGSIRPLLNQAIPLVSGTFFPIALFPWWLKGIAWCLPLTHALTIARSLLMEGEGAGVRQSWWVLVGMTIVLTAGGWGAFALAVRQGRINGRIASS